MSTENISTPVKCKTIAEFVKKYCVGTIYDSCVNSLCPFSSSDGCTHRLHPGYEPKGQGNESES